MKKKEEADYNDRMENMEQLDLEAVEKLGIHLALAENRMTPVLRLPLLLLHHRQMAV